MTRPNGTRGFQRDRAIVVTVHSIVGGNTLETRDCFRVEASGHSRAGQLTMSDQRTQPVDAWRHCENIGYLSMTGPGYNHGGDGISVCLHIGIYAVGLDECYWLSESRREDVDELRRMLGGMSRS